MKIDKEKIEKLIETKLKDYSKKFGKDFEVAVIEIVSLEKMLAPAPQAEKRSRIIPLSKWNEYHDYPTVSALRQHYFYHESNGFDYCVERGGNNGGRILINEDKFFEWQENRKKG